MGYIDGFGGWRNGGDELGMGRKGHPFGMSEEATELGEGREVWANRWGGWLGDKEKYLEDEHIFRVEGSRAVDLIGMGLKRFGETKDWEPGPKI